MFGKRKKRYVVKICHNPQKQGYGAYSWSVRVKDSSAIVARGNSFDYWAAESSAKDAVGVARARWENKPVSCKEFEV